MVLATDAQVLLLDEPLAGMGADESARMIEVLKRLRTTRAILLVEHDMDAVFAVADTITVMVNGQVLESGPPAQIKASVAVQQAYLGQEEIFNV
jgi:branched-chain amino acid transport system ATP-binding protein